MLPPCVTTETSLNRGEWRRLCGETLDRPVVRGVIKCLPYWRDETWCKRIWVVSNILSFLHYLGKCSNLIRIFQMGGSSCRQLDDLKNSYGLNMLTSADGKLAGAGGEDFGDKAVDGAVSTRFGSSGDLFWKARYLLVCMKLEQCNMKLQLFWVRPIVSCWDKGIFVRKTNQLEPLRPLRTKHLIYIYIYTYLLSFGLGDEDDEGLVRFTYESVEEFVEEFVLFSTSEAAKAIHTDHPDRWGEQFPRYWRIRKPTEKRTII